MSWLKQIQETMLKDIVDQTCDADYLENPQRLEVYSQGYFIRVNEVMSIDFALTRWALGQKKFESLVRDFLIQNPSKEYNINSLGAGLPSFIYKHILHQEYPFLSQLAEYEWMLGQSQLLPRESPFDFSSLSSVSIEKWVDAKFTFQPNLLLMKADYAFDQLHIAFTQGKTFSNQYVLTKPSYFIFYQKEDGSYSNAFEQTEYDTLNLLMKGTSLGDVLDTIGNEEMVQSIFSWFQKWNEKELFTKVRFESHESE